MPQSVTRTIYINAEGKGVNTIRGLNAELEKARNAFKNAEIGSEKFIAAQKELEKVKKIHADYSASLRPIQSGYSQLASGLSKFAAFAATAFSVEAVINYGREVLKVANTQEQFTIALNTMVGSKAKADQVIAQGIELATRSPFTITQVQEGTKQLLAMGFGADEVIDKLEILGNIGAGVGVDKLPQLTLALGQVRAAGHLMGQDLNQFVQAGVPLLEEISKVMGKPTAEIIKMKEAGQIGYPIVEKALRNLTTEGGRFAGLMEKQAQSLGGLWSTFGDNFTQKASLPIGNFLSDGIKPLIGYANVLISSIGDLNTKFGTLGKTLEEESANVTVLVNRIVDLNVGNKTRSELISELRKQYPDFLGKLNAETVTNEQLRDRLTEVNQQYVAKIIAVEAAKDVEIAALREKEAIENSAKSIVGKAKALQLAQKYLHDYTINFEDAFKKIDNLAKNTDPFDRQYTQLKKLSNEMSYFNIYSQLFKDQSKALGESLVNAKNSMTTIVADIKKAYPEIADSLDLLLNPKVKANPKDTPLTPDPEKAKQRAAHIIDALKGFNDHVKSLNADLQQTEETGYERDILKVREKYQKQFDALTEFKAKYPEAVSKANAIESELTDLQGKSIQAIISNQFKDLETELEKHNAQQLAQLQSKEDKEIAAINQKYEKQLKILVTLEKDTVNTTEAQRTDAHKKRLEYESLREQEVNNLKTRLRAEQAAKDADETVKFWEGIKQLKDDVEKYINEKPAKISATDDNLDDEISNIIDRVNAERDIVNKEADELLAKVKDDAAARIQINESRDAKLIALTKSTNAQIENAEEKHNKKILADEKKLTAARLDLAKQIGDGFVALADLIAGASKKNTAIQKAAAIAQLAIDTATAISTITAKSAATSLTPIDYAIKVASGIAIVLTNIARARTILATVEQKKDGGFHNVIGASDGQRYKAQYVGAPNTGMLNYPSPVLLNSGVLANERGPEYFVSNSDLRNPAVFNYVQAIDNITQSRTPQPALSADRYQTGGFAPNAANSTAPQGNNEEVTMMMIAVIQDLTATLKGGLIARFEDVWGTIKDIKEYTDRYKKITGEA